VLPSSQIVAFMQLGRQTATCKSWQWRHMDGIETTYNQDHSHIVRGDITLYTQYMVAITRRDWRVWWGAQWRDGLGFAVRLADCAIYLRFGLHRGYHWTLSSEKSRLRSTPRALRLALFANLKFFFCTFASGTSPRFYAYWSLHTDPCTGESCRLMRKGRWARPRSVAAAFWSTAGDGV
jgi:hypothetical protein